MPAPLEILGSRRASVCPAESPGKARKREGRESTLTRSLLYVAYLVARGRKRATLRRGRRIGGKRLRTGEVDAGKQGRPGQQRCDDLLHGSLL
jgi:hypothetical protein